MTAQQIQLQVMSIRGQLLGLVAMCDVLLGKSEEQADSPACDHPFPAREKVPAENFSSDATERCRQCGETLTTQ